MRRMLAWAAWSLVALTVKADPHACARGIEGGPVPCLCCPVPHDLPVPCWKSCKAGRTGKLIAELLCAPDCRRIAAARKLGSPRNAGFCAAPEVLEALVAALLCDGCPEVRAAAASAIVVQLGEMKGDRGRTHLRLVHKRGGCPAGCSPDPGVREALIAALLCDCLWETHDALSWAALEPGTRTQACLLALYLSSRLDPEASARSCAAEALAGLAPGPGTDDGLLSLSGEALVDRLGCLHGKPGGPGCKVALLTVFSGCAVPPQPPGPVTIVPGPVPNAGGAPAE